MLHSANFLVHSICGFLEADVPMPPNFPLPPKTSVGPVYEIVAVLLILLPLLVGAFGLGKILIFRKWRSRAIKTYGDQRGWDIQPKAGPAGTDFPVIFFVANNKSYRCKNCVGFNAHPEILPAKLLGVLYNPDNPEDSYQNTNENFPSVMLWLISSGAICAACFIAWMVFTHYFAR